MSEAFEKLVEIGEEAYDNINDFDVSAAAFSRAIVEAVLKEIGSNPAEFGIEPKVKPLEWYALSQNGNCKALTIIGDYFISDEYEEGWKVWTPPTSADHEPDIGCYPMLEAAKAAAQAHYEKLIKSALE